MPILIYNIFALLCVTNLGPNYKKKKKKKSPILRLGTFVFLTQSNIFSTLMTNKACFVSLEQEIFEESLD